MSLSEMCSLVAVRQEMDSWMKQRMLVEPSQVEQLTFPRACTVAAVRVARDDIVDIICSIAV